MDKCKPIETPISTRTKWSKQDDELIVDSKFYKMFVDNLMYLTNN